MSLKHLGVLNGHPSPRPEPGKFNIYLLLSDNGYYIQNNLEEVLLGASLGIEKTVEISFGISPSTSSIAVVPEGARILKSRLIVEQAYDNGAQAIVTTQGLSSATLMEEADSDLALVDEYHNNETFSITDQTSGVLNIAVSNSPTVGSGRLIVGYVVPIE